MGATDKRVKEWAKIARENDNHYMIIVFNDATIDYTPIMCKDFQDMHDQYHKNVNDISEVIRVDHDGSVERDLKLQNLL